jgi:hypothetical protein
MRKPVSRASSFNFDQRTNNRAVRRAALSAAPAAPFEALEDRRLFSVLAHYYNDGFWGNGNGGNGRPTTPTDNAGGAFAFPNQQISVARAGDVVTTVPNIDFDWGTGSPDPAIRGDDHSTLFVGKIIAPVTGTYEILGYGDDDTHVFVDGQLVSIDPLGPGQEDPRGTASVGHGGGARTIDLVQNQSYDLVVLQAEQGGGSGVRLRWVLPGGDSANPVVVPAANLVATVTPVSAVTISGNTAAYNAVSINFNDPNKSELRYDLQRRQGAGEWTTVTKGAINATSITDYGVRANTAYEYRVVAWNLAGQAVSTNTATVTTAAEPAPTAGAQGYYFNDQWWKATAPAAGNGTDVIVGYQPDFTENVGDVVEDYSDGNNGTPGSPEPGVIRDDNHSTVFTGKITVPEDGEYQILAFTDDDSYLWVNGQLVSADPGGHGIPAVVTDINIRNPITLTAGQYDFVAVHSEGGGGSGVILRWVTPTMTASGETTPIDIPASAYTSNQPSTPAAPTGLTATVTDVSVIRLNWTDNAKSEVRYTLERSTSADFSNATKVVLPINSTSYQDTGLARGQQFFYRITAENFRGAGSATVNASTPAVAPIPAAPTNLVAYNLGNRNLISFTDNAVNESGYIVERRLASGGTFAPVAGSPIAGTAANVSGGTIYYYDTDNVVAGQTYVYRVRAVNVDNGQSANSNEATTTVNGLRATVIDANSVFATRNFYEDVPNATSPLVQGVPNVDVVFDDTTYDSPDPSISPDTFAVAYEGFIQIDTAGSYTFFGESDDGIRVFVDGQLVVDAWVDRGPTETAGTPVELTAGKHEIRVQYYENGGGAMARLRYESTDAAVTKQVVPITKLTPADATNVHPLRAPINLATATVVGEGINVTWVDNSAAETGFQLQRSTDGTNFTTIATLPANQSGYIDTKDINPAATYYYRVVAVGTGGATQTSEATSGTTPQEAVSGAVNFANFGSEATQNAWAITAQGPAGGGIFVDSDGNGTLDRLRLTDGGAADDSQDGQTTAAYYATPFTINEGFTSSFDFVVGGPGAQSGNPADGFTFIIQAATNQGFPVRTLAIGGGGGALGYTGINNSVALKFDIYNNLNQTGLYINGEGISDDPAFARNRVVPAAFDINSGQPLHVTVSYDAVNKVLTQTIDDLNNPATAPFTTTYNIDLAATIGSGSAFVGFTGATGGETARQEVLNFAFDPSAPTVGGSISEVYVRGTAWNANFKSYMETLGVGDDVYGYRVDNKTGDQAVLPWVNVNQIVLRYSGAPTGNGIPTAGTVVLDGDRADYTVTGVEQLDPQTFVLTLDRPLGQLPTGASNGVRVNLTVPGAGSAGGNYNLRLNVLQGDVFHTGETSHQVVANDASDVKPRFFRSTTSVGTGTSAYTIFHDVDGSGNILANDFSLVKARFFQSLQTTAFPVSAAPGTQTASVTKEVFADTAIL